jgi:hypothetical protein
VPESLDRVADDVAPADDAIVRRQRQELDAAASQHTPHEVSRAFERGPLDEADVAPLARNLVDYRIEPVCILLAHGEDANVGHGRQATPASISVRVYSDFGRPMTSSRGPLSTMRLSFITITRCAMARTTSMSWVTSR